MGSNPTPRQVWVDIDEITFAEDNPKLHDLQAIAESEQRYGFVELPVINQSTGRLVAGQGRIEGLRALRSAGKPPIPGVKVTKAGKWQIEAREFPFSSDKEAQAYLYDSNNIGLLGGDYTPFDVMRMWDQDAYLAGLKDLADAGVLPVSVSGDDYDALAVITETPPSLEELQKKYGDPGERDFWPVLKIQVAPDVKTRFDGLMESLPGDDDAKKFEQLLNAVDQTVLHG